MKSILSSHEEVFRNLFHDFHIQCPSLCITFGIVRSLIQKHGVFFPIPEFPTQEGLISWVAREHQVKFLKKIPRYCLRSEWRSFTASVAPFLITFKLSISKLGAFLVDFDDRISSRYVYTVFEHCK